MHNVSEEASHASPMQRTVRNGIYCLAAFCCLSIVRLGLYIPDAPPPVANIVADTETPQLQVLQQLQTHQQLLLPLITVKTTQRMHADRVRLLLRTWYQDAADNVSAWCAYLIGLLLRPHSQACRVQNCTRLCEAVPPFTPDGTVCRAHSHSCARCYRDEEPLDALLWHSFAVGAVSVGGCACASVHKIEYKSGGKIDHGDTTT